MIRFASWYCVIPTLDFFFTLDRHPRDLHSFPTRRSSDLRPSRGNRKWVVGRHARLGGKSSARYPHFRNNTRSEDGDRKSTRLNSSHRCISYAVFCLKKKKWNKMNKKTITQYYSKLNDEFP